MTGVRGSAIRFLLAFLLACAAALPAFAPFTHAQEEGLLEDEETLVGEEEQVIAEDEDEDRRLEGVQPEATRGEDELFFGAEGLFGRENETLFGEEGGFLTDEENLFGIEGVFALENQALFGDEGLFAQENEAVEVEDVDVPDEEGTVGPEAFVGEEERVFGDEEEFEEIVGQEAPLVDEDEQVELTELVENPELYEGRFVRVDGAITRFSRPVRAVPLGIDLIAFILASEEDPEAQVLVVTSVETVADSNIAAFGVSEITVAGEFFAVDRATIEEQLGIELDPALFEAFGGGTVIIAESMQALAAEDLVDEPEEEEEEEIDTVGQARIVQEPMAVELEEVVNNAEFYEGQYVLVEGELGALIPAPSVQVGLFTLDLTAFTLEAAEATGERVVVLTTGQTLTDADLEAFEEDTLTVAGEVVAFDLDTVDERFGVELDPEIFEGAATVIVATSVEGTE